MRRTFSAVSAAAIFIAVAACADPTPLAAPAPQLRAQILDGAHGGVAGFYFLPPLVAQPNDSGTFDPSRAVHVTVCPLGNPAASTCVGPAVTVSPVEVDVNGHQYMVNWQTDDTAFPSDSYYRVAVIDNASGAEWGHVDVFLGATGQGFHRIDQSEFTPLLDGRTVPVKFRLDTNAPAVPPSGGGSGGVAF